MRECLDKYFGVSVHACHVVFGITIKNIGLLCRFNRYPENVKSFKYIGQCWVETVGYFNVESNNYENETTKSETQMTL